MLPKCLLLSLVLLAAARAEGPFAVDGRDIIIATDRYEMVLRDGVFVYLHSRLTGATYADSRAAGWSPHLVRGVTSPEPDRAAFDQLHLVYGGTGVGHAEWGSEAVKALPALCFPGPETALSTTQPDAQTLVVTWSGLARSDGAAPDISFSLRLHVEADTGDLVVTPAATAADLPLGGAAVALSGLDPAGTLLIPHQSGHRFDLATWGERLISPLWPRFWTFGMAVVEYPQGAFMISADDPEMIHKRLFCSLRTEQMDLSVLSCNPLPYEGRRTVPGVPWRLNVYPGNWVKPARLYQARAAERHGWTPLDEQQPAWLKEVRTLYSAGPSVDELHRLADQLTPEERRTVLFGIWQAWLHPETNTDTDSRGHRWLPYNPSWGCYRGRPGMEEFVAEAHRLGFRVLVFVNLIAVNWEHPLLWEEPVMLQNGLLTPADKEDVLATLDERRALAYIHQADERWQQFSIRTLRQLVDDYDVDAVYLDCSSVTVNGVRHRGMTPAAGARDWHRAVRAALPNLALLGEQVHEATVGGEAFALESLGSWGHAEAREMLYQTVHPIGGAIMSDYCNRFRWRGRGRDFGEWQDASERACHIPNTFVDRIKVYGRYGLRYTYPEAWEANVRSYLRGTDGRLFRYVSDHGSRLETIDGGEEFFYWRLHGAATVPRRGRIEDWYAWNGAGQPIGLDPEDYYLMRPGAPPESPFTITAVSEGLVLDELRAFPDFVTIRPRFLDGAETGKIRLVWAGAKPVAVTGAGSMLPLTDGVLEVPGDVVSLVICRQVPEALPAPIAVLERPPAQEVVQNNRRFAVPEHVRDRRAPTVRPSDEAPHLRLNALPWYEGEQRIHFLVRVPDTPEPVLTGQYALPVIGRLTRYADGVTFSVRLNGREIVREHRENGPDWPPFTAPLAAYRDQPLLITLVTEPGPLHQCDTAFWGDVVIHSQP